ncbi:hypothetical protein KW790_01355 [Candidatus Parcubacteria bacterium]|nr:hypothetical protein [Candidatus Parcubacteria bacterium]
MNPEEVLKQQIESAPQEIKEFLAGEEWEPVINNLANNSGLTEEQKTSVENEIIFVLVGLDLRSNLKQNLQNIGLSDTIAKFVAAQIDTKILERFEGILPTSEEAPRKTISWPEEPDSQTHTAPPENLPVVEEHEPTPMVVEIKEKPPEPIVPRASTYQETINKLFTRPAAPPGAAPSTPPTKSLNLIDSTPEVKPAFEIKSTPPTQPEAPDLASDPQKNYPGDKDPYREPLE